MSKKSSTSWPTKYVWMRSAAPLSRRSLPRKKITPWNATPQRLWWSRSTRWTALPTLKPTSPSGRFFLYGPQVALVLTLGEGTHLFVLHPASGDFLLAKENLSIPQKSQEFAINASNFRHWDKRVRAFIEDCLAGRDGPNGVDYNMRWLASVVAEAFRILIRGGIYLYPADHRQGYAQGRLRLLYEANPLAFLIEQAHGAATNGLTRIMELEPVGLHQRTPLVFGSADEVARLVAYYSSKLAVGERSPLFGRRSLFRSEEGFPGCR